MALGDILADMEPQLARLLVRRGEDRSLPPYSARDYAFVEAALTRFFAREKPGARVSDVGRLGGGASKEQFLFRLTDSDGHDERYVLRMDPQGSITATDRNREYQILRAMRGRVPVPEAKWIDPDGAVFGQPALIMNLIPGVTKPSDASHKVSGLGTWLGEPHRSAMAERFIEILVGIHGLDWRNADLPGFSVPDGDPKQAARWTVNYWRGMWEVDKVEERPIATLAAQWLLANLPDTHELVFTHGDYRTGNYLFDQDTHEIHAVLDWELSRIGDYHEDLGWIVTRLFGTMDDKGVFRASDFYERDAFIAAYQRASGREVNRDTLHFYEVLSNYKGITICAANGIAVSRPQHNHQDVLLTFLASAAAMFASELARLLNGDGA